MGNPVSRQVKQAYTTALNWLLPPRCAGCGRVGEVWCDQCAGKARIISGPVCNVCGLPGSSEGNCVACRANRYVFTAARSWGVYSGELRRAILSLKHRRNQELGQALANYLLQAFRQQDWDIDFVIPIPLGTKRKKERGYNQVDLLAAPFAMAAGIRAAENVLVRKHDTLPQFELNAAERWKNLHGSFVADPTPLRGRDVLLLDDIMTTGATLDSAAQALMDAGAGRIYGLTLARALFEDEGEFGKIGYT